jgi:hypothetical protein
MDLFNKCSSGVIGPGGKHCSCCFVYRKERGKRKVKGFSKLRRTRLKNFTRKYITHYV